MSNISVTQDELDAAKTAFFTGVVQYAKAAGRPVEAFTSAFAVGGCMMIDRNLKQAEIVAKRAEAQERQTAIESEVEALNAQLRAIEAQIQAAATGQSE